MNHTKIISALFVATLGASFVHQASAQWGTGGATSIPRKSHLSNYNLFCDMSRVSFGGYTIPAADRVKITTLPSATNPSAAASLKFEGQMFCAEVQPTNPSPSLETAVVVSGVPLVGRFTLTQQSPALRPLVSTLTQTETGLQFYFDSESGDRTWTFVVPADPTQFPFPELLYDLAPADAATTTRFCEPSATPCRLLIGLQLPAKQGDYPPRDIDGVLPSANDLDLGQVFKFTTKTTGGVETPGQFFWGPCRADAFGKPKAVDVDAQLNGSHGGAGAATGVILPSTPARLAVTVNQNDLWNSGSLNPAGRWSNADGQVRDMTSTGHDDSGTAALTAIGNPRFYGELAADTGHLLYAWNGSIWGPVASAPWGVLVGSTDGGNFYIFGTAFDGLSPPVTGELKLYYWDTPLGDNTESVKVTVATEAIRCTDINNPTVPLTATGNLRGERPVEVRTTNPESLDVHDGSLTAAFPVTILGCNIGDAAITFTAGGSPIVLGTKVLVNGKPVDINNSSVLNKFKGPATCDSGPAALPDLQLRLNRLQFIKAVKPRPCRNGSIGYRITLGNSTDGFYGGQSTVVLSDCGRDE